MRLFTFEKQVRVFLYIRYRGKQLLPRSATSPDSFPELCMCVGTLYVALTRAKVVPGAKRRARLLWVVVVAGRRKSRKALTMAALFLDMMRLA